MSLTSLCLAIIFVELYSIFVIIYYLNTFLIEQKNCFIWVKKSLHKYQSYVNICLHNIRNILLLFIYTPNNPFLSNCFGIYIQSFYSSVIEKTDSSFSSLVRFNIRIPIKRTAIVIINRELSFVVFWRIELFYIRISFNPGFLRSILIIIFFTIFVDLYNCND